MHKIQQLIVVIGFGIIVLMGIFPPWSFVDENKVPHSMGYAPIWKPPVIRSHDSAEIFGLKLQLNLQSQAANSIDFSKLVMQIAIVAMVTGGAVFLFNRASTSGQH
jgi:hypothetical protein